MLAEGELFPGSNSILQKQPPQRKPTEEEDEQVREIPNPQKKHKPFKLAKIPTVPKGTASQKTRIESVGYSSNATEEEVVRANRENEKRAKALEKKKKKEASDKVLPQAREGLGRKAKALAAAVNL